MSGLTTKMDLDLKPLLSNLRHKRKNKQSEFGGFNAFLDISRQFCVPFQLNDITLTLSQFHLGPGIYKKTKHENYHIHNELQLEYIIDGEFTFENNNCSRSLGASEGIAIVPWDKHRWHCGKSGIMLGVMLDMSGKNKEQFLAFLTNQLKGDFGQFGGQYFQDVIRQLLAVYYGGDIWKAQHAGNLLHIFLSQSLQRCFRLNQWTKSAATPSSSAKNRKMCDWAVSFIMSNLSSKLTVKMIAAHLGISTRHLVRIFSNHRSETVAEAIIRMRLEQAVNMLKYKDIPIKNIAYNCGFSSPAYFTFCYKKRYGIPPSKSQVDKIS